MVSAMQVRVTCSSDSLGKYWEGMVTLPGLRPTKLQKVNGCTRFSTRSAATQAANTLGRRIGFTVDFTATQAKAAKKSVKSR
jgi:hypothetical protein